ncbi:MAG: aminotransferase class I/II-fold pyridoxal phosphate-dependent enzyme [Roseivirga sp.]|nr:aminotransferase class I/II-fold pyridoxal phosphate-dependent enzyme [Roseivirga sp.]
MAIRTFELERIQSLYENTVDYNLTESGFHPFSLAELLTPAQLEEMQQLTLGYGQTNGSIPLRRRIATTLYKDLDEDSIMVTNGSSEANFLAMHTLLQKGDEVVVMNPNYMQIWGAIEEMGCIPKAFNLRSENNWAPDMDELRALVTHNTKMIIICNPNNPTGYVLTDEEMQEIVEIARGVDAWIYADEVYRGAELNYQETPSFQHIYEKVVVSAGLSKAYALPGIRIGWLAGPKTEIYNTWSYHDYTSISTGIVSQYVAEIALSEEVRPTILKRNRDMLNKNVQILSQWISDHGDLFKFIPPKAGGMAFMKYDIDINSTELSTWLRKQESVFIVPGDCYGMDGHIRIGVGERSVYLIEGLTKMSKAIKEKFNLSFE